MKTLTQRMARMALLLIAPLALTACGINSIPTKEEKAKAQWAEVQNQYQRRADLIPNLVATVKGYAAHEAQVLTAVTEARAKVSQVNVNADDAASLAQYQAAQGELSQALGRLMMVTEAYPNLKADQQFIGLQTQLEGTENRVTVARGRYIQLVQDYNTYIRQFPVNLTAMIFGYKPKPNFTVENEAQIQDAPAVDFATPPPAPVAPPAPAVPPGIVNPPQPAAPPVQGGNAPQDPQDAPAA
jgi:LemA protein